MATPRANPSLASSSPDAKLLQRDVIDAQLHIGYDPDSEHTDRRNILGLLGQERSSEFEVADRNNGGTPGNATSLSTSPDTSSHIEFSPSSSAFSTLGNAVSVSSGASTGSNPALGTLKDTGITPEGFGGSPGSQSSLPNSDSPGTSSAQVSPNGGGSPPEGPGTPETPPDGSNTLSAPDVSGNGSTGFENTPVNLTINLSADPDATSTYIVIGNIPTGAILSAGIDNHDSTWTLTPAQLIGLTMTPPPYYSGDINLSVTAVSTGNGQTLSDTAIITVEIEGVATTPLLTAQSAAGLEDTAIPLTITAALIDTDGSENLSLLVAQVPPGATLSAGTNNGNGTWTLSPSQLTGLSITPPPNFSGQINLVISATSSENGTTATIQTPLSVWVAGVADTPVLSVQSAMGTEDTSIPLDITALLSDTDGSETLSIVIGNMPAGSSLSAGINNGNGTWSLSPAQLSGLTFLPPQHTGGVFSLSITATASENGTSSSLTSSLSVTVSGSATPPFLAASPASGNEDTAIPLSISAGLIDTDGSEILVVTINNVPAGGFFISRNEPGRRHLVADSVSTDWPDTLAPLKLQRRY